MDDIDREQKQGTWAALFVVLAMFAFLCAVVSAVEGAEDADYLRARAAIAIHASQSAPVPVAVESKPDQTEKPFLFVYTTSNCEPCELAKRELKAAKDLPFKPIFDRKPNIEIEAYPTFHWTTKSGGWTLEGWYGVKHLESEFKRSQENKAASLKTTRYTWPGDLRDHLRRVHGVTETLTHEQAVMVHDALHSGYSLNQIRSYARARGIIK